MYCVDQVGMWAIVSSLDCFMYRELLDRFCRGVIFSPILLLGNLILFCTAFRTGQKIVSLLDVAPFVSSYKVGTPEFRFDVYCFKDIHATLL